MMSFIKSRVLPFLFISFCLVQLKAQHWNGNIHQDVFENFEHNNEIQSVLIQFKSILDIDKISADYNKVEKGEYVFKTLKKLADQDQIETILYLNQKNIKFQDFILSNTIEAKLNIEDIKHISTFKNVNFITTNPSIILEEPNYELDNIEFRDAELEWGLQNIKADSVWALGFQGQNAVVAGQDTGYDWTNPLIKEKYRGWNGNGTDSVDHNYNWFDAISEINPLHQDTVITSTTNPCGLSLGIPCDDHGHGSHTMGTMVGNQDTISIIGVAPQAKWIGCRNMDRGYGKPSTYLSCFEFFLAPTDTLGLSPMPSLAPDVINNSWGCPEMEGCNEGNWIILETAINNLVAAGIIVVTSAGNNGPDCGTINRPPSMFNASFVVGASNNQDSIANFSSRGLVVIDSSFIQKPDVVAPGVGVRSIRLNNQFGRWNGTSMAGPHVAGTVALIISANPSLKGDVETIQNIIRMSALRIDASQDCHEISGTNHPNPIYGYGRIDALKAVEIATTISNVDKEENENDLICYPNPGHEDLFIYIPEKLRDQYIELIDFNGKIIFRQPVYQGGIKHINTQQIPTGIYYIKVQTSEQSYVRKWIKQN